MFYNKLNKQDRQHLQDVISKFNLYLESLEKENSFYKLLKVLFYNFFLPLSYVKDKEEFIEKAKEKLYFYDTIIYEFFDKEDDVTEEDRKTYSLVFKFVLAVINVVEDMEEEKE